jgi:hypothetical protein
MRRLAQPGGLVAGYVWDFVGGRGSGWPLVRGMRASGIEPPAIPGAKDSGIEALRSLFEQTGLQSVEARPIEIASTYRDFDDFWAAQTPAFSPIGRFIASLPEPDRLRFRESVLMILPPSLDGSITYSACANAIKARVPGP